MEFVIPQWLVFIKKKKILALHRTKSKHHHYGVYISRHPSTHLASVKARENNKCDSFMLREREKTKKLLFFFLLPQSIFSLFFTQIDCSFTVECN